MARFIWVELFYIIFSLVLSLKDLPSLPELPRRVRYNFSTFAFSQPLLFRLCSMWQGQRSWSQEGPNMFMRWRWPRTRLKNLWPIFQTNPIYLPKQMSKPSPRPMSTLQPKLMTKQRTKPACSTLLPMVLFVPIMGIPIQIWPSRHPAFKRASYHQLKHDLKAAQLDQKSSTNCASSEITFFKFLLKSTFQWPFKM